MKDRYMLADAHPDHKVFQLQKRACERCGGDGVEPGTSHGMSKCSACGGKGQLTTLHEINNSKDSNRV